MDWFFKSDWFRRLCNENTGIGVLLMVVALTWPIWLAGAGILLLAVLGYKMRERHLAEGRDMVQPTGMLMSIWSCIKYPLASIFVNLFGAWLKSIGYYQ